MKKLGSMLLVGAMAISLAGCGSQSTGTTTAAETTAATTAETTAASEEGSAEDAKTDSKEAEEKAGDAADTQATDGTFIVGFDQDFPPMGFVGDDGEYTGFDLELIEKYHNNIDGNKIAKSYEVLKKGGNVDGYSRWDNDVKKRERPILIEAECTGEFIRNARSSEHLSTDNIRNDGRDGNTRGGCIPGFYGKSGIMEVIDKQGGNAKNQEDSRRSGTGAKRAESSVIRKLKQYKAEADKKNNTTTDRTISKGDRGNKRTAGGARICEGPDIFQYE